MSDTLITVENASKKFCRSLKRSLWYGVKDLGAELTGRSNCHRDLRRNEFWAVKDVSFNLRRGECLGLIGRNGAGKTTLLRLLNGIVKPDIGCIRIKGRMQALIALGAGFNPILTGRENVYVNAAVLGIPRIEVQRRFDEIVDFSGLEGFIDTPLQNYSSGMAVRLGFAVAAHMEPDILLVDEVLAVGDEGFQSKCFNKIGDLRKNGTAAVLVSHNMHTISTFAQRVIFLKDARASHFDDVPEGINQYRRLFLSGDNHDIEKISTGNENIRIRQVDLNKKTLRPGESFCVAIKYDALMDCPDAEVDIAIYSSNYTSLYFQATNKAYNTEINLAKGTHELRIKVHNIPLQNATAKIAVAVWAKNRRELLFWWRFPVEFRGVDHSVGGNFLKVSYET